MDANGILADEVQLIVAVKCFLIHQRLMIKLRISAVHAYHLILLEENIFKAWNRLFLGESSRIAKTLKPLL